MIKLIKIKKLLPKRLICDSLMVMKKEEQENNKSTVYEIGCLFVPIITDKDVLEEVSNIKITLEKLGCEFISGDGPTMKSLAYPMKKMIEGEKHLFKEAYFVWLKFNAVSDKMADLKKDLDKNVNILRYLKIKTVKEDVFASNQKKVLTSKPQEEKTTKVIKPAKIVKASESTPVETIKEKEKSTDLDETIDKLVIK